MELDCAELLVLVATVELDWVEVLLLVGVELDCVELLVLVC